MLSGCGRGDAIVGRRQVVDVDLHGTVLAARTDARRVGDAPWPLVLAQCFEVRQTAHHTSRQQVRALGDADAHVLAARFDEWVADNLDAVGDEAWSGMALAERSECFEATDGLRFEFGKARQTINAVGMFFGR